MKTAKQLKATPLMPWVGGKRLLLKKLIPLLPQNINDYYEPFVGGGAMFYALHDRVNYSYLSDTNLDLMTLYNVAKDYPEELCRYMRVHIANHNKEYFLSMRNIRDIADPVERSARFLYVAKGAFRGAYRANKDGNLTCTFRADRAKQKGVYFNEEETLVTFSALRKADIACQNYNQIKPKRGDFVYFDPPYYTTGSTFGFYGCKPFLEQDHINLRDFALSLTKMGVNVMISNSDMEFTDSLYSPYFTIHRLTAPRAMGVRRTAPELVAINY